MDRHPHEPGSLTKNVHSRHEQLQAWKTSDTNKASSKMRAPQKVKFKFETAFLAACSSSDFDEITRLLQEDKVDINTSNVDGLTALHQACIDNKLELVRFLCEHGADLHARDNEGWTPLHATALGGHTEIAKYLMKRGASLTAANGDGDLPVDVAERSEMRNLLRTGLPDVEEAAARDAEAAAMLADATEWQRAGRYRDLRDPVANAGPLHVAAAKGYQPALAALLQCPGVPLEAADNDGWTALHAAAHWGQTEACRLLVANGANMDAVTNANQTVFDLADDSVTDLLKELKSKQREMMQEQVMKRPATVISMLKVEESRSHSMRRSSVTRLPQSERHDLTLKGAEQEKHPEKLLLGGSGGPVIDKSAAPTAAVVSATSSGRSPLASSETLSSDDDLHQSQAARSAEAKQQQQLGRRPTPSPPAFVVTEISDSPPPPTQPPPPLPAGQPPTALSSSPPPAPVLVSTKRRVEIIPATSLSDSAADGTATSRSKVRATPVQTVPEDSILTRMESLQESSAGSSTTIGGSGRVGLGGSRVRSAAGALTSASVTAAASGGGGGGGLSASFDGPLVFPKTEPPVPPSSSRLSQQETPSDRPERFRGGSAVGRLANSVIGSVPADQNGARSSQPPAAAAQNRRVSVIMEKEKAYESETERRRISRHNRATKRLTQGVTPDDVEQARKLMASKAAPTKPADAVDSNPATSGAKEAPAASTAASATDRVAPAGAEEPAANAAAGLAARAEENSSSGSNKFQLRPGSHHGGSSATAPVAAPATDYRQLFETEKIRNEQLDRENGRMRRELDRLRREVESLQQQQQQQQMQQRAVINRSLAGYEAQEKVAQAEAELNKLRLENSKLKADNTSLIRVISRLSTQSAAT